MQLDKGTWMRFAIWMVLGTLDFWPAKSSNISTLCQTSLKSNECFCHIVGFIIYFTYGIRNSAEAAVPRSDAPACTLKGLPMATEKEAFLHNTQNAIGDDEDSWGSRRFTDQFKTSNILRDHLNQLQIKKTFGGSDQTVAP